MNKIIKIYSALLLLTVTNSYAATITFRTDLWCPYACDPKSDRPGFMVEIAKEVFGKHGHTIDYGVMNWARAISDVKSGKYNALIGTSKSDAPDFVYPVTPTGVLINYYWTNANDTWTYKDKNSLVGKKIGVINDYTYGEETDKLVKSNNPAFKIVAGEKPLLRMIQMTENKRINGFIENPLVLSFNLKELKKRPDLFRIASRDLASDPDLFIAFSPLSPKSKEYAVMLDNGMNELRKNGRLKEILAKYGLTDWKK